MFVATLENGHMLIANVAGRMRRSFIRIRRGDRIRVELSPCDLSPGRIVCRYAIDIRRVQDYYQRVQSRGGFKELVKTPPAAEFAQLERMIGAWSQSVRVFRTSTADERWLPIPGTKLASSLYVWGCQHMWGLSPGHTFPEPDGHRRSPKDTKAASFEFRRRLWEPEGHLRTRHRYGSGP